MESRRRVRSPCVSVCALDEKDICIGCHRTGDEILRWTTMTDEERKRVLEYVAERESGSLI
ncbi:DUF1289 domain-containing protein [Marinobacter bryozoorum]|jgi:predicted Fe-S protein YdhL (DUF1289 family)|uniref:DUF1289 domain-containing protein n=1 Tax=Marinobacter bryozoorum TaxID=256324 RepID=UPI002006152F|nr:DUF1289 domain-containing protein [Marinobacter bryozoorum]MCK7545146.1 DUF1289 domain-containing protein [Marinobacter bryozoorum]